jgi:hypothetical protein
VSSLRFILGVDSLLTGPFFSCETLDPKKSTPWILRRPRVPRFQVMWFWTQLWANGLLNRKLAQRVVVTFSTSGETSLPRQQPNNPVV